MSDDADYHALMQFLYRVPIGLVQTAGNGAVEMMNPMASQLLMPLARNGALDNVFDILQQTAAGLGNRTDTVDHPAGVIAEAQRISVPAGKPGETEPRTLSVSLLKLDADRLMWAFSDISAQVRDEERSLSKAARIDALTKMPNRSAVREAVQQAIAAAAAGVSGEFAVVLINCDRFRQINDTLGHQTGDDVLGLMAARLTAALRPQDRTGRAAHPTAPSAVAPSAPAPIAAAPPIAARLGGDEFVVVLGDLQRPEDCHAITQRLLGVLNQPYGLGAQQIHCNVSVGVVMQKQAAGDADDVLRDASIAMMEAKRAGGARYVVFEPLMHQRAVRRGGIEADLRRALAEDQLFVVYQPVVSLKISGRGTDPGRGTRLAGVEALVRWQHPTRGLVPPLEFIGVAEECGLIGALGDFVLDRSCRDFVGWQTRLGTRAPGLLAVNLSRAQLLNPGLVAQVAGILNARGMPASQLQLEVTESLAAQDDTVQSQLHALKDLSLTLALDDFGTGYSSLASLHQLPVDTLKIDRSFVAQSDSSHHHRVLIDATVRVATSLGMTTVAEGIETEAQADVVRRLGCDKGQGYLFSKPLRADDLIRWLMADSGLMAGTAGAEPHPAQCR
jgi:predicted signal transduction protein with EAL and GGDEF domain